MTARADRMRPVRVFDQSRDRMLMDWHYGDRELVAARDLASTRSFLDDCGRMDAADFDAFVSATSKPA